MAKSSNISDRLSLNEKVSLLSGDGFWSTRPLPDHDIPSLTMSDGPNGLRKQGAQAGDNLGLGKSTPATCFPTVATLACSWDKSLVTEVGQAIGKEALDQKVNMVLGPGLNIIRDPLGGRNFEYFSEDPCVSGTLATAMVEGIQSQNVAACVKHFAVNSQETLRMTINELVDERALHEIYLEGFRRVVMYGRPMALMTSYNKVNGVYANESPYLLGDILKNRWGYDGLIVTDWVGTNDRVKSLAAGNDLEMPWSGGETNKQIKQAAQNDQLPIQAVDRSVERITDLAKKLHTNTTPINPDIYNRNHDLSVKAAAESMVLLKNDGTLPLSKFLSVAIIGDLAKNPRYQGAGSSMVNPTRLDNAIDCLEGERYKITSYSRGYKRFGGKSKRLLNQALKNARRADVAIVFVGLDESIESECVDRSDMKLNDNQLQLVRSLARQHTKMVLVLSGGSPVELPIADYSTVKAILLAGLSGQGSGQAVADVISGKVNPSGKLTTTYPIHYRDTPTAKIFPGTEVSSEHRESIYVGYRYYETFRQAVRYPFGYGLSYTTFSYNDIKATKNSVSVTIKNTGSVAGAEVAQLYIVPPSNHLSFRPSKELASFAKIFLEPGESKTIRIDIDDISYNYYDQTIRDYVTLSGKYKLLVGSSVQDIKTHTSITIKGKRVSPADNKTLAIYNGRGPRNASSKDFEEILGDKLPSGKWNKSKKLTLDDTLHQFRYSNVAGRLIIGGLMFIRKILFKIHKPIQANNLMFVINLPLKRFQLATGRKSMTILMRAMLAIVNL